MKVLGWTLLVIAALTELYLGCDLVLATGVRRDSGLQVRLGLAFGGNPNQKILFRGGHPLLPSAPPYGRPLLSVAAEHGDVGIARLLIERGADIHRRDAAGETALFPAVRHGNLELVILLVQRGADPLVKQSSEGSRSEHLASWAAKLPGDTLLHEATDASVVEYLLHLRLNVHARNRLGQTPLFGKRDPRVIRMLVRAHADVNARDVNQNTPLMALVCNADPDPVAVSALLESGAETKMARADGTSPSSCAQKSNDPRLLSLIQAGARAEFTPP